ncbi:MAG: antibiotic biosynthesis monooxygenase [Oscillospiraceae bacterium]|nr:antibiotic biosynthesis monooxygenase [Oscillospiraceae bacterium]
MSTFAEVKLFQVKPGKLAEFEALIAEISKEHRAQEGVLFLKCMKRFFTIDGVPLGAPPRELTKVVKCVKYYSYCEFDTKESYGKVTKWWFDNYGKAVGKLLIAPWDMMSGYTLEEDEQ